jgi:DNA invertase Pin-like site-specific DNA recombinase
MVKPPSKPAAADIGYSYVRFSSPEQSKGDSLRRQTDGSPQAWCDRNGVRLDTTTTLRDLGKSAFAKSKAKGKQEADDGMASIQELEDLVNPDRRALCGFIELIRQRQIPRGSYLIVENLDRLTRDDVIPATNLITTILLAGVRVVQLSPAELVLDHKASGMQVMMMVMELCRGNGESALKSDRVGKAWAEKRKQLRENATVLTRTLPAWIRERDGVLELIPEHAATVRRIFALAASGRGVYAIVKQLTAEKVPAFLARVKTTHRVTKQPIEHPGEWSRTYVSNILRDRRAVGEFQPCRSGGSKDGPPVVGYYPPVVSAEEFYAARAGAAGRKTKTRGRIGNHVNVFQGLLRDAVDGATYLVSHRVTNYEQNSRILTNSAAASGKGKGDGGCRSFPLDTFERGLLAMLREVDPAEVLPPDSTPDAVKVIDAELDHVREQIAGLKAELLKGDIAAVAEVLRTLEPRERELAGQLDDVRERQAKPLSASWTEAKGLLDALDAAPDKTEARMRLRNALRRVVGSIWMLVTARGRDRFASVQIWFADGQRARDYFIAHRPPRSNGKARKPGTWLAISIPLLVEDAPADAELPGAPDLRDYRDDDALGERVDAHMAKMIAATDEAFAANNAARKVLEENAELLSARGLPSGLPREERFRLGIIGTID